MWRAGTEHFYAGCQKTHSSPVWYYRHQLGLRDSPVAVWDEVSVASEWRPKHLVDVSGWGLSGPSPISVPGLRRVSDVGEEFAEVIQRDLLGKFRWCPIPKRPVRATLVICPPPRLDAFLRLLE